MSAVIGVWSRCATGRIYVGNVDINNAEMIIFNGVYVQQSSVADAGRQLPVYKHESREQFIHAVVFDGLLHWRVAGAVGGQADFVDYLSAPSVASDDVTSPDMTSHWYFWNTRSHSWLSAGQLSATCVAPDFVTCTSGLLSVSGLSRRHQRWHRKRMGTYHATSMTSQLRPVYKSVLYSIQHAIAARCLKTVGMRRYIQNICVKIRKKTKGILISKPPREKKLGWCGVYIWPWRPLG